jgi:WhiB family redox-sensing transcriptional regulator
MSRAKECYAPRSSGAGRADWRDNAACHDVEPDLFFPIGTTGPALLQINEAKRICEACPVREPCLRWALKSGEDSGVWGGTTGEERRALRYLSGTDRRRLRQEAARLALRRLVISFPGLFGPAPGLAAAEGRRSGRRRAGARRHERHHPGAMTAGSRTALADLATWPPTASR